MSFRWVALSSSIVIAAIGCGGSAGDAPPSDPTDAATSDSPERDDVSEVHRDAGDAGSPGDTTTLADAVGAERDAESTESAVDSGLAADAGGWSCASSAYMGKQYWTCKGGTIHKCDATGPIALVCTFGCVTGPAGTDDVCNAKAPPPVDVPTFDIVIKGGLFTEAAVRKPLEDGLRYEIERIQKHIAVAGKKVPHFQIVFSPASTAYCTGIAYATSTNVDCPKGYPITGDNQNYVVNIALHEIGHILAQHLVAPPEKRDTCTNEGIASWIAGKYWMNAASKPVASLKLAANHEIDLGKASATMTSCISASDAWYKVYASYFEYLELFEPGAILSVGDGTTPKGTYTAAWQGWMKK